VSCNWRKQNVQIWSENSCYRPVDPVHLIVSRTWFQLGHRANTHKQNKKKAWTRWWNLKSVSGCTLHISHCLFVSVAASRQPSQVAMETTHTTDGNYSACHQDFKLFSSLSMQCDAPSLCVSSWFSVPLFFLLYFVSFFSFCTQITSRPVLIN
jgi:hypothetical protein